MGRKGERGWEGGRVEAAEVAVAVLCTDTDAADAVEVDSAIDVVDCVVDVMRGETIVRGRTMRINA